MTTYLVLSTITQKQAEYGTLGRIEVAKYQTREMHNQPSNTSPGLYTKQGDLPDSEMSPETLEAKNMTAAQIEAKGEEWLENLIERLERGEI